MPYINILYFFPYVINKQSHVKVWFNRKKYGAVSYLFSCTNAFFNPLYITYYIIYFFPNVLLIAQVYLLWNAKLILITYRQPSLTSKQICSPINTIWDAAPFFFKLQPNMQYRSKWEQTISEIALDFYLCSNDIKKQLLQF